MVFLKQELTIPLCLPWNLKVDKAGLELAKTHLLLSASASPELGLQVFASIPHKEKEAVEIKQK